MPRNTTGGFRVMLLSDLVPGLIVIFSAALSVFFIDDELRPANDVDERSYRPPTKDDLDEYLRFFSSWSTACSRLNRQKKHIKSNRTKLSYVGAQESLN